MALQYPDAERLFREDMKTFKGFCKIFAPEQLIMFKEMEKQFMSEFDYRQEALQMQRVRKNMLQFRKLVKVRLCAVSISHSLHALTL